MIRTFLEFLLSRSHDEGTPPTGWLRRLLARNTKLNRYDAETRQLDTLLRSTAAQQRQALSTDAPVAAITLPPQRQTKSASHAKTPRHTIAWFSGLAVCAIVLVAFAPNWSRPTAPTAHAGVVSQQFAQQLTVVPGKILRLLSRVAKTSQTQLPQISPLANLTLPTLTAWKAAALRVESPVREEINFWQKGWQKGWKNLRSRLPGDRNGDSS